jgi:hypothetical protein
VRFFRDVARAHVSWAVACLGWRIDDAWQTTPADVYLAHDGWLKLQGLSADSSCTTDVLNNLMKSFPDD